MSLKVICVGNELLTGKTVNSNLVEIAKILEKNQVYIDSSSIIKDEIEIIKKETEKSLKENDTLIFVGGLGPTTDDLTKEGVAKAINENIISCPKIIEHLKTRKINEKDENYFLIQAKTINKANVLFNKVGFAPGLYLKLSEKKIFLFPGPPRELIPMFCDNLDLIIPKVENKDKILNFFILGIGEYEVQKKVEEFLLKKYSFLRVYYYHKIGKRVHLKIMITQKNISKEDEVKNIILNLFENIIIFKESFRKEICSFLQKAKKSLSIAESCSSGLLGKELTNYSGASDFFYGGIIAYNEFIKEKVLNVSKKTLKNKTAYSEECALEMLLGLKEKFSTDIGISITGIAGPNTEYDKKVGEVFIGIRFLEKYTVKKYYFVGTREEISTTNNRLYLF